MFYIIMQSIFTNQRKQFNDVAISKKNSRKINVDNNEFRWSPSQDSGYMVLTIQHGSGQGRKIEVIVSDDKNVIIENGNYTIEVGSMGKLMITPSLVRKIIQDARHLGWIPLDNGKPLQLRLDNERMELETH